MNSDVIFSFIRQGLTIAGTYFVTKGVATSGTVETVIGSIMGLLSVAWSYIFHKDAAAK